MRGCSTTMGAEDPYIGVPIEDGGYKIVDKIGEGAMGVVYRGVQDATGTEVAIKILHIKYALEREFVKRFKREVDALRSLRHPNTVRIIDNGTMDDGSLYIVMELLQGRGLDIALKQDGPWPLDRAISMVLRVAYALEEAHRLGIVHRDLKPENIFLVKRPGGFEIPKLLDFGLAKMDFADDTGMEVTKEGAILGTPAFMSPEQSFGEKLDARADIYSLAVILYELVTGHLPFEDDGAGPQIARYLNEPIPIDQRVEGLTFPPGLWPVLACALQKLPEDRFSTAMELAEALKPFNTMQLSIQPPSVRSTPVPPAPMSIARPPRTPVPPRTPIPQAPRTPVPQAPRTPIPPPPVSMRMPSTMAGPSLSRPMTRRAQPAPPAKSPLVWVIVAVAVVIAAVVAFLLRGR